MVTVVAACSSSRTPGAGPVARDAGAPIAVASRDGGAAIDATPLELACPSGATIVRTAPPLVTACVAADGTRDGPFVERFPDGTVAVTGAYAAGVLDGPWQRLHPGGAIAEDGAWARGKQDGAWRQLAADGRELARDEMVAGTGVETIAWDDGTPSLEVSWKDGVRHGRARGWDRKGVVIRDETWVDGALDGDRVVGAKRSMQFTESWDHGVRTGARTIILHGEVVVEEHYQDGKLHGTYTTWRDQDTRREAGTYRHGERHGRWTGFDKAGEKEIEGSYVDGGRDGTWTTWKRGVVTSTGTWKRGKPDGAFVAYDRNGDEVYRDELPGGTGTRRERNGGKKTDRTSYVDGVRDGVATTYHPNGKLASQGSYAAGVRDGAWTEAWPNGEPRLEATYAAGELDGAWRRWRDDGTLDVEATYANGARAGRYVEHRPDGAVLVEGAYAGDLADGEWLGYHPGGAISVRATWARGALDGPYEELREDGSTVVRGEHAGGRRVGTWTWTGPDGAVTRTDSYER